MSHDRQFIAFYDNGCTGDEQEDRIPISTGTSREEAIKKGIPRMLEVAASGGVVAMQYASLAVVAQPQLEPDEFADLTRIIDDYFAGKTKPKEQG